MASISFTAVDRGYLYSGHSEFTSYDIDFEINQFDETLVPDNVQKYSLNRTSETLFNSVETVVMVTATTIDADTKKKFKEWYTSVLAGEAFGFDAYGTAAVPGDSDFIYANCRLDGKVTFTPERIATVEYFRISFKFRVENPL